MEYNRNATAILKGNVEPCQRDLLAQPFSEVPEVDEDFFFYPLGCYQKDRMTLTGYQEVLKAALSSLGKFSRYKGVQFSVIEHHNCLHDDGYITNEGISRLGTITLKGR